MKNKIIYSILILAVVGISFYLLVSNKNYGNREDLNISSKTGSDYTYYKASEYGPEFSYPKSWGSVTIKEGNKTCPEEDTYRTPDSLHVFDWEFSFPDTKLPGSDSFIRTGIRTYELNPKKPNGCGSDFLTKIARREVIPETLSSFKLDSITTKNGLSGTFNQEGSRLNTESRTQYTLFVDRGPIIQVIQPYMSFVPYFGSPELKEMEEKFGGDMERYLREGKTAESIRRHREEFIRMVESLKWNAE